MGQKVARFYAKSGKKIGASKLDAPLVREMGLEPTRRKHTHLKRACLPVPALSQIICWLIAHDLLYPANFCLSTVFSLGSNLFLLRNASFSVKV